MEMVGSERKKSPLAKKLLFLALILLALVGISSITSEWVQQGTKNRIGIVDITGLISDSQFIVNQVKKFRKDKRIRGIILRIDSPGGAVGPSQEIYNEVLKTRESGKTIYASMGALAASGGYYIASAAERIRRSPRKRPGLVCITPG